MQILALKCTVFLPNKIITLDNMKTSPFKICQTMLKVFEW